MTRRQSPAQAALSILRRALVGMEEDWAKHQIEHPSDTPEADRRSYQLGYLMGAVEAAIKKLESSHG